MSFRTCAIVGVTLLAWNFHFQLSYSVPVLTGASPSATTMSPNETRKSRQNLPTVTATKTMMKGSNRWRQMEQQMKKIFLARRRSPLDSTASSHHRNVDGLAFIQSNNPLFCPKDIRRSKRLENKKSSINRYPTNMVFTNGFTHNHHHPPSATSLFNDLGSLFPYPQDDKYNNSEIHHAMMQELRREEEIREREQVESRDRKQQPKPQPQLETRDTGEQPRQQSKPSEIERNNQELEKGIYLDPETYSQADSLVLDDGSLGLDSSPSSTETSSLYYRNPNQRKGRKPPNMIQSEVYKKAVEGLLSPVPIYSYRPKNAEDNLQHQQQRQPQLSDEDLLLEAVSKLNSIDITGANNPDAESLHRLVFAEEETYLNQSLEFRKSLSTYYGRNDIGYIGEDDDGNDEEKQIESPIAKERRLAIEAHNNKILEQLMKDMEKMEEMAPSREEALRMAASSTSFVNTADTAGSRTAVTAPKGAAETELLDEIERPEGNQSNAIADFKERNPVLCYKCGCQVTPEVIERARMLVRYNKGNARILCQACHGMQFRQIKEAEVRLATGYLNSFTNPSSPSSSAMFWERRRGNFDDKNRRGSWTNDGDSSMKSWRRDRRFDNRRGYVQGGSGSESQNNGDIDLIDTATKKGYSNRLVGKKIGATNPSPTTASGDDASMNLSKEEARKRIGQNKMTQTNTSAQPKSNHQEKRKIMHSSSNKQFLEKPKSGTNNVAGNSRHSDEGTYHSNNKGLWVKVTDPKTKRMFYWNRETGEMKRRLSE